MLVRAEKSRALSRELLQPSPEGVRSEPTMLDQDGLVLPDFLIVGAMKAGTTTLSYALGNHPEIFRHRGEVHFFDRDANWRRGKAYYASFFREWNGERTVGEKTASYSYSLHVRPPVPERIRRILPGVKLIWCLRNPVDRAYSQYQAQVSEGYTLRSFESVVGREIERGPTRAWHLLDRGIYVKHVRRFLEYFSLDRMHFVVLDELLRQPAGVLAGVLDFLDVDRELGASMPLHWRNATALPRSLLLQRVVRILLEPIRPGLLKKVMRANLLRSTGYPPMSPALRARLEDFYRPHNAELAGLTGLDLSAWDRPLQPVSDVEARA